VGVVHAMKKDLAIGTICHSNRHGHSTWILEEDKFKDTAVIYPGEKMPWMRVRGAYSVCGMLKSDKRRTHRFCNSLECRKEYRKDGKNVYWRLLRLGRQTKYHKNLTLEEGLNLQLWEGSPEVIKEREAKGESFNPLDFMNFDCPVYDGSTKTLREATEKEREFINLNTKSNK
jgi:hypothetical protein